MTLPLQELLGEVEALKPDVETLKDGKYHNADVVEKRCVSVII